MAGNLRVFSICKSVPEVIQCQKHRILNLERGDQLTIASQASSRIWVILRGTVAFCNGLADGRRQIVELESSGSVICGLPSNNGSNYWLEALSDCTVCEVSLNGINGPMQEYPDLLNEMFLLTHQRLQKSMSRMVTLGKLDNFERVAELFHDIAIKNGKEQPDGVRAPLPLTQEDIADYLGINTGTVSRLITSLRKAGVIKLEGRTAFLVTDMDALRRRFPNAHEEFESGTGSDTASCPKKEATNDR